MENAKMTATAEPIAINGIRFQKKADRPAMNRMALDMTMLISAFQLNHDSFSSAERLEPWEEAAAAGETAAAEAAG